MKGFTDSPFPGMDPYLERHWLDVHASLVPAARNALNQTLPDDLIARIEERVAVEAGPNDAGQSGRHPFGPDVRVFEAVEEIGGPGSAGGGIALAPFRLSLLDDPITERFIEIIDVRGGERLVTVIEFVSPSNKLGDGLSVFVNKRTELLAGGTNVVEIDLVREGNWRRLLGAQCPAKAESAYRATLRVPSHPTDIFVHPFPLREPLPTINIPLRPNESPCQLPLQPLIEDAYKGGRYGRTLDYTLDCDPPLAGPDAVWADERLRSVGRRT